MKIEDLCSEIGSGGTPLRNNPSYWNGEILWLKTKELSDGPVFDTEEKITIDGLNNSSAKVFPSGSIVIAMYGATAGKLGIMKKEMSTNQACLNLVTDTSKVDNQFLYYSLLHNRKKILKDVTGSAQQNLNAKTIKDFEVSLPLLHEQQKIASVLSALDDQIELNNQINQELEALAQTLYNYWFVQFEFPNEEGKPYKSSGGKMVWNEELKREIPEGWEVKSLSEIADFTNGLAMQKYRSSDGFASLPVIKIKEMKNGITSETERCKLDIPEKLVVKSGDILFSWSASLEVMMWTGEDGGLNQHIYKVVPKLDSKSFCYATLKNYLEYFRMIALSRKTTMGHITRDHLENSFIAIPCEDVLTKFTDFTDVCLQQIISIGEQNQELIQLRDYLLPLLMNGQVGFSDEVK